MKNEMKLGHLEMNTAELWTIVLIILIVISVFSFFICIISCCYAHGCVIGTCCCYERDEFDESFSGRSMRRVDSSSILKDCRIIKYNVETKRWGFFRWKYECRNSVCTICLEDYTKGEEVVLCPCKHCYHKHCIKEWLKLKNSCPMCKLNIRRSFLSNETTPLLYDI